MHMTSVRFYEMGVMSDHKESVFVFWEGGLVYRARKIIIIIFSPVNLPGHLSVCLKNGNLKPPLLNVIRSCFSLNLH